jgi:tyrosyl-tRNA synthetase
VVIVTPLLVGTDGVKKMSKSVGNYIAVTDPPAGEKGMFGKIMSLPDDVMDSYYLLLTDTEGEDYRALIRSSPRDAKVRLAREVIGWLHSPAAAEEAEAAFRRQFVEKQVPTDMPQVQVGPGPHRLAALLVKAGLAASNGEATRKVKEGAVDVDEQRVTEFGKEYLVERPVTLRLGRKFARVVP